MLHAMVDNFSDSRCDCLPRALFAYREIPVETLVFGPFELIYGYPFRGPLCVVRSNWLRKKHVLITPTKLQYMLSMRERVAKCYELVWQTEEEAAKTS